MTCRPWLFLCACAVALAPAPAQVPPRAGAPTAPEARRDPAAPSGERSVAVYHEATSRELFFACDSDSDDRLDLFEACEAMETLGDPRDPTLFRRLDRDRDGFVSWPEFDQHYRQVVQRGGVLRVRPCRRLATDALELRTAAAATPIQKFLQLHDRNGDGGLDADEIDRFVRQTQLPNSTAAQLKALDLDRSGRVDESELAPYFDALRASLPGTAPQPKGPGKGLPPQYAELDANGDGTLDRDELAAALRRLDPALDPWAPAVFAALDRDRNGRLDAAELGAPQPTPKQ
jgi:Ca2+-binding EF-hand superfamily protein